MRRTAIAMIFALVGLAACDVEIEIRRGKNAAPDAGALVEAPEPTPTPVIGKTDPKPVPKDKSLKEELGDVWNKVERDGKELARDAEDKARELAHDADKKGGEIKKDVEETIEKKDLSPAGLLGRIPWWGWALIFLLGLVVIGGILDALDIFEGFFEALGKLVAMLVEVLVKAAVALAKGAVSLVAAIGKAFGRKREREEVRREPPRPPEPPRSSESDADRELREAEARYNEAKHRKLREDLDRAALDPFRGTPRNAPSEPPRPPAPPQAPEPPRRAKRDSDGDKPGIAETVGVALVGVATVAGEAIEAAGEAIGDIAESVGDIDIDLD